MRSSSAPHDAESRTLLRWRHYLATDGSVSGLREFHAGHRLLRRVAFSGGRADLYVEPKPQGRVAG